MARVSDRAEVAAFILGSVSLVQGRSWPNQDSNASLHGNMESPFSWYSNPEAFGLQHDSHIGMLYHGPKDPRPSDLQEMLIVAHIINSMSDVPPRPVACNLGYFVSIFGHLLSLYWPFTWDYLAFQVWLPDSMIALCLD